MVEQMIISLNCLVMFLNAASVGMLATFFPIGKGKVKIYTNYYIRAILICDQIKIFYMCKLDGLVSLMTKGSPLPPVLPKILCLFSPMASTC
ncbi:putative signal peptide protein [Puccinia sorghi]|uniref:Putative signal peptide protein n=1 Tax=Puccinia sorghi TaxID=27349 RepID=A0A0L6VNR8_9BASI|nr:putative signal peptide protein [Puccinia sorghi]